MDEANKTAQKSRDQLIEEWFVEHMHGAPVATVTHIFNHVRTAVDDLKRRLAKED